MATWIQIMIPVLLSLLLGPGTGQLYNREYKKGGILVALGLLLLLAFSAWLTKVALTYLPADVNAIDRTVLRNIIEKNILQDHALTFYTYQLLLGVAWVYSVVDAYFGAVKRLGRTSGSPDASEEEVSE